jgi:acyl-CoA thioesterase FadM
MTDLTRLAAWTIPPDEIDHLRHMSTLFYAHRADQGALRLLEALGAAPQALADAGLVAAVVDRHTLFRREQLADATLTLAGAVAPTADPERIGVYEEMANAAAGELAATFRLEIELQDRATRRPVPLPAPWREAAAGRRIEPPSRSHPRSLPLERMGAGLTLADFARAGIASHRRREILPEACDADGFLPLKRPKLSTPEEWSAGQGVMDNVWTCCPGFVWPALEKRALLLRPVRRGDVLDSYEAILSVGHKVIHSATWIFEARSQALVAVTHQVNVFFSFATRKTLDMPAELRARLGGLASVGLVAG